MLCTDIHEDIISVHTNLKKKDLPVMTTAYVNFRFDRVMCWAHTTANTLTSFRIKWERRELQRSKSLSNSQSCEHVAGSEPTQSFIWLPVFLRQPAGMLSRYHLFSPWRRRLCLWEICIMSYRQNTMSSVSLFSGEAGFVTGFAKNIARRGMILVNWLQAWEVWRHLWR